MTTIKAGGDDRSRAVSFNTRVTVVLIPERREIKEAQCDLWWSRSDFSSFQQSAHNEIRLYSLYENVNCKEAKNLLYQPNETDGEREIEDDYVEIEEEEQLDMNSRDSELEEAEQNMMMSPAKLMRHVDSVSLLAAYEENPVDTPKLMKAKSSLANLAQIERTPSVSYDDPDFYVSLCVPSVEFDSLSTKESLSGGTATQNSTRVSGHRIDQSSGFAVVCGIFSFTLPILGFYLMHYSS